MGDHAGHRKAGDPVVLVTAGAGGIGRVIAESFLAQGYCVHVCDIDPQAVSALREQLPDITASVADVTCLDSVRTVFDQIVTGPGRLDVLVNNVGIAGPVARAEEISADEWDRTIAVNLSSHFYFAREAIPLIKSAGGGAIINIASSAAFFGCPLRAPYASSKWGLIGLTKTLAMELGAHRIRVNAICPGSVDGERIRKVMAMDARSQGKPLAEIERSYRAQNSMKTFVDPGDVAGLAVFLASEAGSKISGQAIGLDGNTESFAIE